MQLSKGSDKVYSIYLEDNDEYLDHLVQDGDIMNDVFMKFEYLGEIYGGYNYLLQKEIRDSYLQKMQLETIKVTLQSPSLGLMRGHKVNFIRYVNDSQVESRMEMLEKAGAINTNIEANIPLADYELNETPSGSFKIDKTVSGQYLIYSTDIIYNDGWSYVLTLVKPASTKVNLIN
jgi:hypothetical protein